MKNIKLVLSLLICIISSIPVMASAATIINNNGIEISEEEYANFSKIYSHEYIMTMDENKHDKLLKLDYDNLKIDSVTKYIETTYNPRLGLTTEKELTEEEYENFDASNGRSRYIGTGTAYYETTAKKLSLLLVGGNTYNYVILTATWKVIPTTRSFDVIGFRGYGFDFRNGSQSGDQIYVSGGVYNDITYSWNGTNINNQNNGFGISMNIVNSNITALQLIAECDVEATIDHPELFASYQHAINNLTLAQSQNYTLGGSGLGGVFVYPYNISQKYDGMSGLILTY